MTIGPTQSHQEGTWFLCTAWYFHSVAGHMFLHTGRNANGMVWHWCTSWIDDTFHIWREKERNRIHSVNYGWSQESGAPRWKTKKSFNCVGVWHNMSKLHGNMIFFIIVWKKTSELAPLCSTCVMIQTQYKGFIFNWSEEIFHSRKIICFGINMI